MRQHKIVRADVVRVIAGVTASMDDEEDEKNPEPGIWQTDENDLPKILWAQKHAFRTTRGAHNKLILEAREHDVFKRVVPVEERDAFLRDTITREDSDVPLSRDSGFHILQGRCIGVSRRDWAAFIKKQAVLQQTQNIPVERRKGGIKIEARGHLEMDLIEGKKKDVIVTFMTDDWYWLSVCDVLTGLLIVKRLNNKEAGTTAQALGDVLTQFRQALGAPLLSVQRPGLGVQRGRDAAPDAAQHHAEVCGPGEPHRAAERHLPAQLLPLVQAASGHVPQPRDPGASPREQHAQQVHAHDAQRGGRRARRGHRAPVQHRARAGRGGLPRRDH